MARQRDGKTLPGRQLRASLLRVEKALHAVRTAATPSAVHRLRVATRRARAGLLRLPPDTVPKALDARLDALRAASGPLRDLDVLRKDTLPRCRAETGARLPATLRRLLAARRQAELDVFLAAIAPLHAAAVIEKARLGLARARRADAAPLPLPPLLRKARKRLRKRGKAFRGDGPEAEHRLRIGAKKMRYLLETLPRPAPLQAKWRRRCENLQTSLGALRDLAMGRALLEEAAHGPADAPFVERYARWQARAAAPLRRKARRQIEAIAKLDKPWRGLPAD
ncbi:CHAD domain-containing protein [Frateuria defendens]|uniref:CHAD domain-containing protein n=1 Tax=Frateuria defendens TaxID=2219559 RepID=UPI00066FC617|nr:CHAD domain-containing protein [Frateuria defendens]